MSKQEMSKDDSFDRLYKASARFFTHPRFFAGMTVVIGLFALLVTLSAILQPMPAFTRGALIFMAVVLWLFTLTCFNWWQKWKIVSTWKREQEQIDRLAERITTYFAKVDAGEVPADTPIPPEIRQAMRDFREAWRRELLRQEGL